MFGWPSGKVTTASTFASLAIPQRPRKVQVLREFSVKTLRARHKTVSVSLTKAQARRARNTNDLVLSFSQQHDSAKDHDALFEDNYVSTTHLHTTPRPKAARVGITCSPGILFCYPQPGQESDPGVPVNLGVLGDAFGNSTSAADYAGANLTRAQAPYANLAGMNLTGANLGGANLLNADLYGANLRETNLPGAILYGADLGNANLISANLTGAIMTDANLNGATLTGVFWDNTICPDGSTGSTSHSCVATIVPSEVNPFG